MAEITAKMVADLRAATGLGMMECKKALVEAEGNIEKPKKSCASNPARKPANWPAAPPPKACWPTPSKAAPARWSK